MKKLNLPDDMRQQLAAYEGRWRRTDTITALAVGAGALAVTLLLLFGSDRLWDTPPAWRALALLAGWGVLAVAAGWWLKRWVLRRPDEREVASRVQRRYRQLGDRLLGVVELADPARRPDGMSEQLCAAAINQVSVAARVLDFKAAVDTRRMRRGVLACAVALLLLVLAALLAPQAALNAFHRWFNPLAGTARYTFAGFEGVPHELVVPHGEAFTFTAHLATNARWQPETVAAKLGHQPAITVAVAKDGIALFKIPGQTAPAELHLRAGDATATVAVVPRYRPRLVTCKLNLLYPAYLQRQPVAADLLAGEPTVPAGSRVEITGVADRDLRTAQLVAGGQEVPLTIAGTQVRTAAPAPTSAFANAQLTWTAADGLAAAAPLKFVVHERTDLPPEVTCPEQPPGLAMLAEDTMDILVRATDDLGVQELAMNVEVSDRSGKDVLRNFTRELAKGGPYRTQLEDHFLFAPTVMDIPAGSMVKLRATTRDYNPEHPAVQSVVYTIIILTHAEHAKLLEQQFDDLRAKLEDLIRAEETLLAAKEDLQKLKPADLANQQTTDALERQVKAEEQVASQMKELAKKGAELLKEAARNPEMKADQTQEIAKEMGQLNDINKNDQPQMMDKLQQASSSPSKREENLQQATDKQKEMLDKLRKLQKESEKEMEKLTARNFHMRMDDLKKREDQLAKSLQEKLPALAGANPADLDAPNRTLLQLLADQQGTIRGDTLKLQKELGAFFQRTRMDLYDKVATAMTDAKVDEGLTTTAGDVAANRGGKASQQAITWTGKFAEWTKMLAPPEPPKGGGGGGGGGGGQQMTEEQWKMLMALMRLAQAEDNVRNSTHLLQRHQNEIKDYPKQTKALSAQQFHLNDEVGTLFEKADAKTKGLLDKVGYAMVDAGTLLRNLDTGDRPIAAENEAEELLMLAFDSSAQSSGASASQAQMLQQLAAALAQSKPGMGDGKGKAGGGSKAGGPSDLASAGMGGPGKGTVETRKPGERQSGKQLEAVPVEFREAVESFFKAADKLQ